LGFRVRVPGLRISGWVLDVLARGAAVGFEGVRFRFWSLRFRV
jgi:hypothetical protein